MDDFTVRPTAERSMAWHGTFILFLFHYYFIYFHFLFIFILFIITTVWCKTSRHRVAPTHSWGAGVNTILYWGPRGPLGGSRNAPKSLEKGSEN